MDAKTTALIEKLADKLGTTAEHLWGVLIAQAPISGFVDLIICSALVFAAVGVVRFVKRKTTTLEPTSENGYITAEWEHDGAALGWFITGIFVLGVGTVVLASIQSIAAAFLNPEYWALTRVLGL